MTPSPLGERVARRSVVDAQGAQPATALRQVRGSSRKYNIENSPFTIYYSLFRSLPCGYSGVPRFLCVGFS